jgi:hypothetical protein
MKVPICHIMLLTLHTRHFSSLNGLGACVNRERARKKGSATPSPCVRARVRVCERVKYSVGR